MRLPPELAARLSLADALPPPAQELLKNPSWDKASARILILRLSPFIDVDCSSTHKVLFSAIRATMPTVYIDFSFFATRADQKKIRAYDAQQNTQTPFFYGLITQRTLDEFDLVLVSNAIGFELVNISYLFKNTQLVASARARLNSEQHTPLIILGGLNAGASASLTFFKDGQADAFVDGFFFGEAEAVLAKLCAALTTAGESRAERLKNARQIIAGFHSFDQLWDTATETLIPPKNYTTAKKIYPTLDPPIFNSPEASTARLLITGGCPGMCSFCFEGWERRPYREHGIEAIIADAITLKKNTGARFLDILSFNFNTHKDINKIIIELSKIFWHVNFMSQRLDILSGAPALVRAQILAGKSSFTLGIEGISAAMRNFYRKGLSPDNMRDIMHNLFVPGVREIKLFYIIAGIETENDFVEFQEFVVMMREELAKRALRIRIVASAGYLLRIPRTPMQFAPLIFDEKVFKTISERVAQICAASDFEYREAMHFDEYCTDQMLAMAGTKIAPWIATVADEGLCYETNLDRPAWPSLHKFAKKNKLYTAEFLGEKNLETPNKYFFPLAQTRSIYSEYLEAKAQRDRKQQLTLSRINLPTTADIETLNAITKAKQKFANLFVEHSLTADMFTGCLEFKNAFVFRGLLQKFPECVRSLFVVEEYLVSNSANSFGIPENFFGKTIFFLKGPKIKDLEALAGKAGLKILDAQNMPQEISLKIIFAETVASLAAFKDWLAREHLRYTETKHSAGIDFKLSADSLKKKSLLSAQYCVQDGQALFTLSIGAKAQLKNWLKLPALRELQAVHVEILAYKCVT